MLLAGTWGSGGGVVPHLNPHPELGLELLPDVSRHRRCCGRVDLVELSRVGRTGQDDAVAFDWRVHRELYRQVTDVEAAILAPLPHCVCPRKHGWIQITAHGCRDDLPVRIVDPLLLLDRFRAGQ